MMAMSNAIILGILVGIFWSAGRCDPDSGALTPLRWGVAVHGPSAAR